MTWAKTYLGVAYVLGDVYVPTVSNLLVQPVIFPFLIDLKVYSYSQEGEKAGTILC